VRRHESPSHVQPACDARMLSVDEFKIDAEGPFKKLTGPCPGGLFGANTWIAMRTTPLKSSKKANSAAPL